MVFQCINIRQVPWEVLKTAAFDLGFQHLPWDLENVNAWKTMFDPYIGWLTNIADPEHLLVKVWLSEYVEYRHLTDKDCRW